MKTVQVLTISALERETGVSRSTIHFYIRQGLLPQPQKTAASRSLYTEDHVTLLRSIGELKGEGRSLAEIKAALQDRVDSVEQNEVDLVAQEKERVHRAILRVATQEFATKGYKRTRVATIIRKLGITPHVFYAHFPSKRRLLVECFNTFITWNLAFVEPELADTSDLGTRLLWRLSASLRVLGLGSDVISLVRMEGVEEDKDLRKPVEEAWAGIIRWVVKDLESMRPPGASPSAASDELLAYSMVGAFENTQMRASWDDSYSREDLLRTHLWLFLAVQAAMSGEVDIESRLAPYEDLIKEVAAREPESPPALDDAVTVVPFGGLP